MKEIRIIAQIRQVGRDILEDNALQRLMPRKNHRRVIRYIEPFVGINREGISMLDAVEQMSILGRTGRKATKRRIDMKSEGVFFFQRGNSLQVIKINGIDRTCIAHNDAGRTVQITEGLFQRCQINCLAIAA